MSMNSMYPNGWFSFGAAALKVIVGGSAIIYYCLFAFAVLDSQLRL